MPALCTPYPNPYPRSYLAIYITNYRRHYDTMCYARRSCSFRGANKNKRDNENENDSINTAILSVARSLPPCFSRLFDRSVPAVCYQLGNLLEALGVEVTEERLREAFTELDRGGDGIDGALSFDDFEAWWASDLAAK